MSEVYKTAGVDIEKGDALVDWLLQLKEQQKKLPFGQVDSAVGGFAGLFRVDFSSLKNPHLVACTDGVGTKVLLAIEQDRLEGIGCDLVAMCVNDLYTLGASPLFFLDYYASGKLDEGQFKRVLQSIRTGLNQANCALLGGETAEMPGLYAARHFDLAGFVVGVVDKERAWGASKVTTGDLLVGLESSGFHSNGYSLIRKWLSQMGKGVSAELIKNILEPTKIYHELLLLDQKIPGSIHAAAHITGGGISGNLPRVLPQGTDAVIDFAKIPIPSWMQNFISANGHKPQDVETVFNLGLGMILVINQKDILALTQFAKDCRLKPHLLGQVEPALDSHREPQVRYSN